MSHKHNYRKVGTETYVDGAWQFTDVTWECKTKGTCDRRIKVESTKERFQHKHHMVMTHSKQISSGKYLVYAKCTNTEGCTLKGREISGERDRPRW